MTRKDYIAIARGFRTARPATMLQKRHGWFGAVVAVADELAQDNVRFDRQKFLDACGVEPGDRTWSKS